MLRAEYGNTSAEARVRVIAGKTAEKEIDLNAGHLRMHAILNEGGKKLGGVLFRVYREQTDASGKRTRSGQVASSYEPDVAFTLSEGDYVLRAEYGNTSAEARVRVIAGESSKAEIVLMKRRSE